MMRMPTVIVRDHGHRDVTEFCLARQLRFLEVGHADHVHAKTAMHIRLCPGGKLRTFHAQICSTMPAGHADSFARSLDYSRQFTAYGISESNMRDHSSAEKCIHAMARAIKKLIRDHKIQWLVFFFQRTNGGNGNNPLDSQLFESVDIRAEVQFAGQDPVAASMSRQ